MADLLSWFGDRVKDIENTIGGVGKAVGGAFAPPPQRVAPQRPVNTQPSQRPLSFNQPMGVSRPTGPQVQAPQPQTFDPLKMVNDLGKSVNEFVNKGEDGRNFIDNASDMLVGNTARLVNTANSGVVQPLVGLAQGKSPEEVNRQFEKDVFTNRGGFLDVGTVFPTQEAFDKTRENPINFTKGFTGAGVGAATEIVPALRGTSLVMKPGLSTGQRVVTGAAEGAGYGMAGNAAQQAVNQQELDPTQIIKGGAVGAVTGGGIPAVAGGVQVMINKNRQIQDDLVANGMSPQMAAQGGFSKVPGKTDDMIPLDNTTSRPGAEYQKAIEDALNRGDEAGAQKIVSSMPKGDLRDGMQSTLNAISGPHIAPPVRQPIMQQAAPTIKPVKAIDKAFRSNRSIIERQGAGGKKLAEMLQGSRDTQELYLGELQKAMPTVTKIARPKSIGKDSWTNKTFENFIDAVEGKANPVNEDVAKAVAEWKTVAPQIRQRAVNSGLDVGDLGPNYYPHLIDYDAVFKDRNKYAESIEHLVKSGQAKTPEEAIKLLGNARDVSRNRSFGSLEASRLVDLPFYDKTPNSLTSYLNGSTKRIAHTETFGAKDQEALKLINKIAVDGGDAEAAKNAFDISVGAKKYSPLAEKTSGNIRKYITTTRLGLGAMTNISQNVNTGIVTGHLRTLGAMVKQLDPKQRDFVANTGVISDALLNDLRTQAGYESFASKVFGKAVNKVTAPFFGTVEKFNRSVAATAGRDYALRLVQAGKHDQLRKLGVTGEIKDNMLTEAQQVQAARKIVEKTQFKVDPQDLPGWVDSPGGKLVAQFRTFSYNQGKFFSNEILKPAAKGNLMPLARLMAALPLGYALYQTRALITNQTPEDDPTKIGLNSFSKVGGAGLPLDIYNSLNPVGSKYLPPDRRVTMAVSALGGPAAGVAAQGIGAISEAIQPKNVPEDESRLEGKVAIQSEDGKEYRDLTPAARFGLSQIPIAGTTIKNTLLPYSKEAKADAGVAVEIEPGKTSTADAIKSVNKQSKQQLKELEKQVGEDVYAISNLNDNEKSQLIDKGVLTQDQIESAEETVKNKRLEMGLDKQKVETYNDKYLAAKKDFEKNSKAWSSVQRSKKQMQLDLLSVQKDFSNDTINLYGMNKDDVYALVTSDPNGKQMVEDLLKYDDKLVASGMAAKSKFKDKYGNIKIDGKKASGKGRGKKGKSTAIQSSARRLAYSTKVPKIAGAPSFAKGGAIPAPKLKSGGLKKFTAKKTKPSKTRFA